jgi:hypothetical protein
MGCVPSYSEPKKYLHFVGTTMIRSLLLLLLSPLICHGFFVHQQKAFALNAKRSKIIVMADIQISTPTPTEAASLGVREWPQQLKSGDWTEEAKEGSTLTRYILDGTGSVSISSAEGRSQQSIVGPGTLVEVTGKASLQWSTPEEIIVLTPGYEEGGLLIAVALSLFILTISLISGVGGT